MKYPFDKPTILNNEKCRQLEDYIFSKIKFEEVPVKGEISPIARRIVKKVMGDNYDE
jgi:hypothetical protein